MKTGNIKTISVIMVISGIIDIVGGFVLGLRYERVGLGIFIGIYSSIIPFISGAAFAEIADNFELINKEKRKEKKKKETSNDTNTRDLDDISKGWKCPTCGTDNSSSEEFCTKCLACKPKNDYREE